MPHRTASYLPDRFLRHNRLRLQRLPEESLEPFHMDILFKKKRLSRLDRNLVKVKQCFRHINNIVPL